jgi:hypothetical protein
MPKLVSVAWLIVMVLPGAARAADRWQFGVSPTYSTGKYGTDAPISIFQTPVTARRLFDDGDVTVVFPFTCISGSAAITVVNGIPVRTSRLEASTRTGGRTGRQSAAPLPAAVAPAPADCGIGDLVVRGRYYLADEHGPLPTIALRAHVKAPTAREALGLGTGRPDEGIGLEVSRTVASGLLFMVDGGYTVIGEPPDVAYDNNWWYDVGLGRDLAGGLVNLSVFFEEDRAIVPEFDNARDMLAAVMIKGRGWRFQAGAQFGLSDGAPALGITLGASRRF